ncbi:STAS/SEC14 domain-containing protein [Sulfitobacter pseudonitzschiae]|uniref:STAS/SEC14 domain-containing protein n=1 Tax=Pseudosulfitobacter pseudonitzschiae TaxID=1402135 RepID=A0A9Q2RVQ6_9RHOB|nr:MULTISPECIES: STAS/SEC14 domain-containing protein [Roseobacteraceae]MBM2290508.1 STAS/SEC14 domain-containing protein [Pseudosulfitobacter pseudonitzschiae]MBM2295426.1 STAS/SEC14 domain-containing protein [Pseudosulfitobacter pseudonitzschiae]MBM2300338.1 STAS/SEC14 domain-containing protein [Pseudosulfitobacter pseudonitzschiae]MBM2310123.1 STAS/SEC14 domain-containing protein [Pseudosulfitobacter pseudonitzschiae]MBM2315035.1 STAS/SEC14 domain-containing protein [Pseudosulfitobacter pse|tara:strand:- start:1860 stop:2246 length:387 start_codon:yes stop_codon:yes gene_type:complete
MLQLPSLIQVAASRDDLYVFRITGEVSAEDMSELAAYMNDVFDKPGKVDLMLIFDRYDGAESGASFSWETLKSRLRAVSNLNKYVVVGASDHAAELIEAMGSVIPVDAETFDEEISAWRYLDAEAVAA